MTTIAFNYKDGEIAVDGRVCCGDVIMTDSHNKIIENNDRVFILAGSNSDIRELATNYPNEVSNCELVDGFMIERGHVYSISCNDNVVSKSLATYNDASGSGYKHALSALDYGATAEEAVKHAMTRDVHTGGEVQVIKVK